jgi:glycine cleavage system aminomethyltransferase T
MKKGQRVSWTTKDGNQGFGVLVADEDDGHALVAVMSDGEKHHVIWCTVTWLTAL